ncbi:hypothetical protein ACPCHT_07730 [Nucisporomicrobium flavum]|uniref:hypothetical protein n=1 Tax=Nucisporomicrobium flavum TaxID=2785915 RepID=UPI0018F79938|nr:hypothetical protein [Nucisporomicrobium flavum]
MKVKLSKQTLIIIGVVCVALLIAWSATRSSTSAQGPGQLDDPAAQACTDYADGYAQARSKTARLALADKVSQSSRDSDNDAIQDRATALGRSAADGGSAWKQDGDAFEDACRAAGWNPR